MYLFAVLNRSKAIRVTRVLHPQRRLRAESGGLGAAAPIPDEDGLAGATRDEVPARRHAHLVQEVGVDLHAVDLFACAARMRRQGPGHDPPQFEPTSTWSQGPSTPDRPELDSSWNAVRLEIADARSNRSGLELGMGRPRVGPGPRIEPISSRGRRKLNRGSTPRMDPVSSRTRPEVGPQVGAASTTSTKSRRCRLDLDQDLTPRPPPETAPHTEAMSMRGRPRLDPTTTCHQIAPHHD